MGLGTYDVWRELDALAKLWRGSDVVGALRVGFPECNAPQARAEGSGHLAALTQRLRASMSSVLDPVVLQSRLEFVERYGSQLVPGEDFGRADYQDWKRAGLAVESAFAITLEWTRSRLPGYPNMFGPHFAPGSSYVTTEFTFNHPWRRELRAAGLQFQPAPPGIATALGLPVETAHDLERAAQRLASALGSTPEWSKFESASAALDDEARGALRVARAAAASLLAPESIDRHEPSNVMRRVAYRGDVVEQAVGELSGVARDYAVAFGDLNGLIDTALGDVLGALLLTPSPVAVRASGVQLLGDLRGRVGFDAVGDSSHHLRTRQLVRPDESLITEAVLVDSVNFSFDNATGLVVQIEGRPLSGSSSVWRDGSIGG